jgi:hypothetical protein
MSSNDSTSEKAHPVVTHEDRENPDNGLHVVPTLHQDGTTDLVDARAVGGDVDEMPKGYYRSWQFIGTVTAQCLASICAYLGWVLPANTL